ncbi:DUF3905 domain-containing protein [Bacillaceae bacterium S4-13-58]
MNQINAPSFNGTDHELEVPFENEHGVVIGDSYYDSPNSPLNHWSLETEPSVMSGPEWVHPTNDIGWNTRENRHYIEAEHFRKGWFSHPYLDTSYEED